MGTTVRCKGSINTEEWPSFEDITKLTGLHINERATHINPLGLRQPSRVKIESNLNSI